MAEVFVNLETGQTSNKRKGKKQEGGSARKKPNPKPDLSKVKKGMIQTTLEGWFIKPRTATRVQFNERVILKRITLDKESWTGIPLKGFSDPNSAFAKKRLDMKRRMAHDHYWRRQRQTPRNAKRVAHILKRLQRENTNRKYQILTVSVTPSPQNLQKPFREELCI